MTQHQNAPTADDGRSRTDPEVLQAKYFLVELERSADELVNQIDRLALLKGGQREAERRRAQFYEVRQQIEALRQRFGADI